MGRATNPLTPQPNQRDGLYKPHPRLALAIFLNHLWLREVECLLVSSSDDSLGEMKSVSTANRTEHLKSAESIRGQSGFLLSSAEIRMTTQLRAQDGGPGIGAQMSRRMAESGHLRPSAKQCRAPVPRSGRLSQKNQPRSQLCSACAQLLNPVGFSVTLWTAVHQAPLSRQEYWSGLPFPPSGGLPNPGTEPTSMLAGGFFTIESPGKP